MIAPQQPLPASSGDGPASWIILDANAVIDYVRESVLHNRGYAPTGRRAGALRVRLGLAPRVLIPETASSEARRNLKKDLVQKLGYAKAMELLGHAHALLCRHRDMDGCRDKIEHVPVAREMYARISGDSDNHKLVEWERKKGEFVDFPVLGTDANDLAILSTAVHYLQIHPTELWTHDMDFTMFADEIYETFGLRVVDTYRLGGRFL